MTKATHKDKVIEYLENEPRFRERRNKDRGIVNLLMRKYYDLNKAIETSLISKDVIVAIVQDYASMDRQWRKTLEERSELRGTDYDQKDELVAKKTGRAWV